MNEWAKYLAYGTPFALPAGDTDSDGDCDGTDTSQIQTWINNTTYDVRGDLDLDGDVDSTDKSIAQASYRGTTLGFNVLSALANRRGYAGYELDWSLPGKWHVRHRVLDSTLGRWLRRDPLRYRDGPNLYCYGRSKPHRLIDSMGMSPGCSLPIGGPGAASPGGGSGVDINLIAPPTTTQGSPKGPLGVEYYLEPVPTDPGCCALAELSGGIPKTVGGFVACCGGTLVPCVASHVTSSLQSMPQPAAAIIERCILEHEKSHMDAKDVDAALCRVQGGGPPMQMPWVSGTDNRGQTLFEVDADNVEIACIESLGVAAGCTPGKDMDCFSELFARVIQLDQHITSSYYSATGHGTESSSTWIEQYKSWH